MKKTILLAAVMMLFAAVACSGSKSEDLVAPPDAEQEQEQESMKTKIKIAVGGREFDVTLEDNAAARDFVSRLPLTLQMEDLNRNEKYGYVSGSLPANAQRVNDSIYLTLSGKLSDAWDIAGGDTVKVVLKDADGKELKSATPSKTDDKFLRIGTAVTSLLTKAGQ